MITYNTKNSKLADDNVLCIAIDSQNNKWIGTEGGCISVFGK